MTVLIPHMNANKIQGLKARWELHKNFTSYFEQILENTPQNSSYMPNSSHLTNHPRQTRQFGHYWRSKDEFISNVLQWTPTYGHISVGQPATTSALCKHCM